MTYIKKNLRRLCTRNREENKRNAMKNYLNEIEQFHRKGNVLAELRSSAETGWMLLNKFDAAARATKFSTFIHTVCVFVWLLQFTMIASTYRIQ